MPRSTVPRKKKTSTSTPHLSGKPPMFRLYFFWRPGCHYCEKGKKYIAEFEKLHRAEGAVLRINAQLRSKVGAFEPAGVPAYLLCISEREVIQHEGLLKLDELEDLLQQGQEEYAKGESGEEEEEEEEEEDDSDEEEEDDSEEDSDSDSEHEVVELIGGEVDAPLESEDDEVEEESDEDLGEPDAAPDTDADPDESNATVEEESKEALSSPVTRKGKGKKR